MTLREPETACTISIYLVDRCLVILIDFTILGTRVLEKKIIDPFYSAS
jgi:hypothetical protein